jgi:Protein of unknown function (DUF3829)
MKRQKLSVFLGLGLACSVWASACQKTGTDATGTAASGAEQGASAGDEDKDNELSNKLSKYIDCLNSVTPNVTSSRDRYLGWVDEKAGLTGKEKNVNGLSPLHSADYCLKELDAAKALSPQLPEIDAAADQYKAHLTEFAKFVKTVADYYEQGNYKDDQFAKGKEYHTQLMAGFDKFKTVNDAMDTKVTKLNDEVAARRLARLEKDPEAKFEFLYAKAMHEAKSLIKLTEVESIDALAMDPYTTQLTAFDKALTDLDGYVDTHKEEASKVSGMSSLIGEMKDYLKATKELQRRKRDNKDFAKEEPPAGMFDRVDGHPAQIVDKYNDMISASNRTRF